MADKDQQSEDGRTCPNCGQDVTYRGVGRRPIWCSTRCRNDAALRRLGARKGAVEVRLIEVPRHRPRGKLAASGALTPASGQQPRSADEDGRRASPPSPDQALRVIRNDPEAVGKLLAHLERRRAEGTLAIPEWLSVRNALRLITRGLPPDTERPATSHPSTPPSGAGRP
jgi:hypothetical protein